MKAIISSSIGGPDALSLQEISAPACASNEVRLAVKAVGINYPDVLIIEDKYQFKPQRPFSPGGEISGEIVELGADCQGFAKGDRVLAMVGWGGLAEEICVDTTRLTRLPASMPYDEAAAFLMTYGTSYYALKDRAALKAGETLLVLGAAGGVGLAAVELGKAMGARVIAAASSEEKLQVAKAHGADQGILYPAGALSKEEARAFTDQIKAQSGGEGANVIYDAVGGDYSEAALRGVAWEGRFLVIGFPAGIPKIPLNLTLLKSCQIVGVFWGAAVARDPARHHEAVAELLAFYAKGQIKPHISARFPLAEGADAIRMLAQRRAMGKVVVTVG